MAFAEKRTVGIIGLGDMGGTIANILHDKGYPLIVYNRSDDAYKKFADLKNVRIAKNLSDLAERLRRDGNAVVWLMVPGGTQANNVVAEFSHMLRKGDIVIDGANAKPTDSLNNYNLLAKSGVSYIDVGCGGGPEDLAKGMMPIMAGGDRQAFKEVEEIISAVSNGNCGYVGRSGAGQTVKLVHNIMFYAIGPALAEGFALLDGINAKEPGMMDIKTAHKLLGSCMPINGEVVQAIIKAKSSGIVPNDAPEIKVSEVVKWGADELSKSSGVEMPVTKAVLDLFPNMSKETRRIYAGAKKIITGH